MLAEHCALSFPTVSKIVDNMETKGQLAKFGMAESINGRRAAVYALNPAYAYILCIYFQYGTFTCVIGNTLKQVVSTESSVVLEEGYIKTLEAIIARKLAENPSIQVISIGVPASVLNGKILFINNYEELQDFDLAAHVEKKFKLRTVVEREMNAMMCAICLQKEYEQDQNLGMVFMTTDGPGCTSLINGHILRGHSGVAGEIGFLPLYDRENLQEIALKGFIDTDLIDYMAKIIACIAVTTNPKKLIIIKTAYSPTDMRALAKQCERYILKDMVPILELIDAFHTLYQTGLLELGRTVLFE